MKKIILALTLALLPMISIAQKPNLDKLPEKERNEYLLKVAYEAVMKHAPEWYSDCKEPVIMSFMTGPIKNPNRLVYSVRYPHDPQKMEEMPFHDFSVAIGFFADTGEVSSIGFGTGWSMSLNPPKTRSGEPAKPLYFPNPYLKK